MHLTAPVHSPYTGRDRLDQVVAIRRNDWTRSSECAAFEKPWELAGHILTTLAHLRRFAGTHEMPLLM